MPEGAVLLGRSTRSSGSITARPSGSGCERKRDFGIRIENLVRHPDFVEYLRSSDRRRRRDGSGHQRHQALVLRSTWCAPAWRNASC
jgi:hypothetical protein